MKKTTSLITFLFIILAVYWSFNSLMPIYESDFNSDKVSFSTDRALAHVKQLSQQPHAVGFDGHKKVRQYIISELKKMKLQPSLQEGYTAGDLGSYSKAINILARIKGSESRKALLLLSHYDSNPHSSLGASDAGSGIAAILEGIRAFLASNPNPKNDIIILFSDAEEIGLNGAELFVKEHPWKKDVAFVLNFEARGSGGPAHMFIETNQGNSAIIKEFTKANLQYSVSNSLTYSVYKLLPNTTDLNVFRENANIDGFNFAFIDDHYDYHTAKDSYNRLDKNALAHQGSYLMPLLKHFSTINLSNLKSFNDSIYFTVPFYNIVSYPFEWIWPMYGIAVLSFILLLVYGFQKKILSLKKTMKGFIPVFIAIVINGLIGFFSWSVLKLIYPHYEDMLHGFTYNGHTYIFAFAIFSLAICFLIYHKFKNIETSNLLVAPIFLWLLICALVGFYLPGASFFIIPLYGLLVAFLVLMNQKIPNAYLLVFLGLPALFIYVPFVKMFPVGLGLKMMITATFFTTLTFFLLLPLFGFYKNKKRWAYLGFVLFLGAIISAHFNSGFSKNNAKPTSLLYVLDANTNTAQWASYENDLSQWTAQYIGNTKKIPQKLAKYTISSKYNTAFTYVSEAPIKPIAHMNVEKIRDTTIDNSRFLELCITPQRKVNRLEVYTNNTTIESAKVNTVALSQNYLENRKSKKLLTHYISDNDYTNLQLRIPKDSVLELTLYEASNDLLSNLHFTISPRPEDNIPMPFVLNDAILVTKTIRYE